MERGTNVVAIGYTMMCEQAGPDQLVRDVRSAENAGFDFSVISDHYFPWLPSQGHSGYAWSILGAAAQATERIPLMTFVTCPTTRYHPAIVAQKAATVQILSDGRFTLGLGSGENLNEHVVGRGWPAVERRQDMLREAIKIIRELFGGQLVNWSGEYFQVDSARLWDVPDVPVGIAVAMGGPKAIEKFARLGDHLVAVEPDAELVREWHAARQAANLAGGGRVVGQIPVCWDPDRDAAVQRAHDQFRWFAGGWKVNAELPGTAGFAGATQFVRREDVADNIPCGPDVDTIVSSVSEFWKAGFTDVALVQIGGENQDEFLPFARDELLPALRGFEESLGTVERALETGDAAALTAWLARAADWRRRVGP
jgi:G6PDH family F420-dependent oxidoreductase